MLNLQTRCSECSNILLTGAYKVGKEPGSFICSAHQSTQIVSEPPVAGIRTGPAGSVERPTTDSSTARLAPHHSSVLSSTVAFVPKPVDTSPAPQPWTASAQRTQAARQKFFQSAAPEAPPIRTKLPFSRDVPAGERVSMSHKELNSRTTSVVGRKLSEDNCNNNNSCPFVIRSSRRRWGTKFSRTLMTLATTVITLATTAEYLNSSAWSTSLVWCRFWNLWQL